MDYQEAIEWMEGIRDMSNLVQQEPHETWNVRVEQANAAKMEQAYWFLRYHKELKD